MYGIDVSEHSGKVDWTAVIKSGKTFAFIRATEGVSLTLPVLKPGGFLVRGLADKYRGGNKYNRWGRLIANG